MRLAWYQNHAAVVTEYLAIEQATQCRDPKDNKFLDAALAARADVIVCSDNDLLVLHPYGTVDVLSLRDFRQKYLTD